ncbi:hypothetical protein ACOWNX_05115 [Helicobacter pylori]
MKTSQSKKSNPKTKGSVLNASLVFKKPSFLNKNLTPNKTNIAKKEKRNQQRENPLLERRKRLRS